MLYEVITGDEPVHNGAKVFDRLRRFAHAGDGVRRRLRIRLLRGDGQRRVGVVELDRNLVREGFQGVMGNQVAPNDVFDGT